MLRAIAIVVALASVEPRLRGDATPRLKVASRTASTLTLTGSGRSRPDDPAVPVCIVSHAAGDGPIESLRSLAEVHLRRNPRITDIKNFDGGPLVVDGVEGYELTADARDLKTRAQMRVYQVVVPAAGRHFSVTGMVSAEKAAEFLAEFRRIAQSLWAVPGPGPVGRPIVR